LAPKEAHRRGGEEKPTCSRGMPRFPVTNSLPPWLHTAREKLHAALEISGLAAADLVLRLPFLLLQLAITKQRWLFSLLCIDTCRVGGMLWVPRILFFLSPTSPHACLFGYLPLTMLLLRALNACISFLLLILLGSRQFCPVYLCSFCCASLGLTVLPLLVGAQP
jgi:hypothetical protein